MHTLRAKPVSSAVALPLSPLPICLNLFIVVLFIQMFVEINFVLLYLN